MQWCDTFSEFLTHAARRGDVDVLRQLSEDYNADDLMRLFSDRRMSRYENFIRRAMKLNPNYYTFVSKALKMLPPEVVIELLCQGAPGRDETPLHHVARFGNIFTVKLLVNAYVTAAAALDFQGIPPWLRKNSDGNTPLGNCFTEFTEKMHEGVARYLVSRDHHMLRSLGDQKYPVTPDESSTMAVDKTGASILFCAVREGFSLLAEQILTSGLPYSLSGTNGENPLHHASKCNEQVSRLLLERHPEFIVKEPGGSETVLHRAVEDNAAWLVKLMLIEDQGTVQYCPQPWNKACRRLIWHINPDSSGDTPLHSAARKGYIDIVKLIVEGYQSAFRDEAEEWDVAEAHAAIYRLGVTPLWIMNSEKDIPLIVALKNKHDDLGVYILSVRTIFDDVRWKNGDGKNAYEIAIENGCEQSRNAILERIVRNSAEDLLTCGPSVRNLHPSVLKIVRRIMSTYSARGEMLSSKNIAKLAVQGLPMFARDRKKDANLHLKEAAARGDAWLVKLLLEGDISLMYNSTPAWQIACKRGRLSTLFVFIEQCAPQDFISLCQHNQQTPLHHIKRLRYEQYKYLLTEPVMQDLKNQVDGGGATPLHRALERNNIGLAKALLQTKGIKLDIMDQNHKTALDLLEENYITNAHYFELYKELLANPLMTQELRNRVDNNGATSLHRAIERNDIALTKALLETKGIRLDIRDRNHKTAVDLLEDRCTANDTANDNFFELYKELLANPLMTLELKNRVDDSGATSLHRAILQNARRLVMALVETKGVKIEVKNNNGKTSLNLIEERCSVRSVDVFWYELYKKLLVNPDRLQRMKNRRGGSGATPLHIAIEWDDLKMAKKLVHTNGVELNIRDTNGKTALDLIVNQCKNDSRWYELYKEVLNNPNYVHELKNRRVGNDTPLHLAIKRDDIKLAKMLLETNCLEVDILDGNGKTALDLLKELYASEKWGGMCREIKVDPSLKVFGYKYLLRRTPFTDMRGTLSVVAALLATITFAAGFTVPGGVDSKYGTATLATKVVFLVFSISNTLAMCSSMVVLFMVIGAMYWEAHPRATPLIDSCMSLLQLSLLCTILAFMTGVYAIMAPKVMWAAILVIALCSAAFLVAFFVVATFWPLLYKPISFIIRIRYGNRANTTDDTARAVPPHNQNQQPQATRMVQMDQGPEP